MANKRGGGSIATTDALSIDLSPAGVAERRRRQAIARNLAAQDSCRIYGVDLAAARPGDLGAALARRDFDDLCEALGLVESASRPGFCRCGNELPWSAATPHAGYHGQCRTCATGGA